LNLIESNKTIFYYSFFVLGDNPYLLIVGSCQVLVFAAIEIMVKDKK